MNKIDQRDKVLYSMAISFICYFIMIVIFGKWIVIEPLLAGSIISGITVIIALLLGKFWVKLF